MKNISFRLTDSNENVKVMFRGYMSYLKASTVVSEINR